ncbi:PREDICTED: uncharacterized protein LOC106324062 [Brassica oleracea var. oleracea]|uniref:uncharacterized protein LOC106324062 n=1 Tax=Brassica oleracea var. oleracea TaxID=109376 RepID=UPI0006A739E1|nr:PREDICTED: uncharacterized protein LOC106324062 [Brassica oleracea var. oleracea]
MDAYLKLIQDLSRDFSHFALTRIPRSKNTQADALAALASSSDSGLRRVIPVEFIEHPSIRPPVVANLIRPQIKNAEEVKDPPEENGCDSPWLEPIREYIINRTLPTENCAAYKINTQAARYVTVEGEIYKWRFSGPLMTCAEGEKARRVMEEVHSGSCGNHSGRRSLAGKIKRHGYYWPTMIKDCEKFARKCEKCQSPAEVEFPRVRRRFLPGREDLHSAMLLDKLDLINERRDQALIRIQNYQHAAAKYYNSNVRHRTFKEGDLVLRKVFQNTAERNAGKLGENWDGPYKVIKVVRPG